jgi:hypothetical protein
MRHSGTETAAAALTAAMLAAGARGVVRAVIRKIRSSCARRAYAST